MKTSSTYQKSLSLLAVLLIAGLIISPLIAIPPDVGGIPVWYQDTFFGGLVWMGIAGIITIIIYWTGQLQPVRWNIIDLGVLALLLYMVIRTSLMEFIPQSSWIQISYLGGVYGISRMLWPAINKKELNILFVLVLITGIAEAGYGLGQLYGFWASHHHLFSITGTFSNPGPYSGWLACLISVAVYGIFQNQISAGNRLIYYLGWSYLFLGTLILVPASSRAALLAAVTGIIVVSWPKIRSMTIWKKAWVKGSVLAVVVIGLVFLYLMKKDSADGRLLIYKVTADMIADAPLFGWGWDGFPRMYNNFQAVYFQNGHGTDREKYLADNVTYGFNEVLEFTAEMGIIGLFLLMILSGLLIHRLQQYMKSNDIRSIHFLILGVFICWFVFSLFSYPMSIPALALFLPLILSGMNTSLKSISERDINSNIKWTLIKNVTTSTLIAWASIYSFYWIVHYRPLAHEWITAISNQKIHLYQKANSLYAKLYPNFRNEGIFLQYAGKSYSQGRQFYASAQILERSLFLAADPVIFTTLGKDYTLFSKVELKKGERAEFLLSRAKFISPYKYYPRYLLTQLYMRKEYKKEAMAEAKELLSIPAKIRSPATVKIRAEMQNIINQEIIESVHELQVMPLNEVDAGLTGSDEKE